MAKNAEDTYAHIVMWPPTPPYSLPLYLGPVTLRTTPDCTLNFIFTSITLLDSTFPERPLPGCPCPPTLLSLSSVYRYSFYYLLFFSCRLRFLFFPSHLRFFSRWLGIQGTNPISVPLGDWLHLTSVYPQTRVLQM